MDLLFLSRLQFAMTAAFHFLFVPMTLGVVVLVAIMQTFWYKTGEERWLKLVKFFGKLFLINFAIGVVTGISLEFQFGMNWAEYSKYVGDIFGVPLAIEATVAFFLESVFLGLWIFGWNKVSKKIHLISIWMVALGSNLSALWILFANGFMQRPVGYILANGRVELVNFSEFLLNQYGWVKFFHTVFGAYVVGAFFVMGVSAYHLLKNRESVFRSSFKLAAYFGALSSVFVFIFGDFHAKDISKFQPTKFAAMESVWETKKGADYPLIVVPDEKNEKNLVEAIKIPKFLSILAAYNPNYEVKGLRDFSKEDRPPVLITFLSFRIMVVLGFLFIALSFISVYLSYKNKLDNILFLKAMLYSIPLPYIAMQLGWIVAEVGRQPWAVYGLLKTKDAVSQNLSLNQVIFSFLGYGLVYTFLGILGFYLMVKNAKKSID
ncbi:MAG TPA: cytochrome ubiquinol oxidase subunit I [Elusimicrobiales bacterium]|nr:cytochrome ubiquinol oxidase subunit I [Elusimicrobiales bacterium]HOL62858.1 cytochrome ubiquinol oxidase subunit I [Elusimicrobiales bacterium]HPO95805.1 cytochrome ubiquinol oxidase subunit I [Elusimicrobiales bacterium]